MSKYITVIPLIIITGIRGHRYLSYSNFFAMTGISCYLSFSLLPNNKSLYFFSPLSLLTLVYVNNMNLKYWEFFSKRYRVSLSVYKYLGTKLMKLRNFPTVTV